MSAAQKVDALPGWGDVKTPEGGDDGVARVHPVRRAPRKGDEDKRDQVKEILASGSMQFAGARPDPYTIAPLATAEQQSYRSHGILREVFNEAVLTIPQTAGFNARWQRDCIYQLGQSLRESVRAVAVLNRSLLDAPQATKIDGGYQITCSWCGRSFTAKRPHKLTCQPKCKQTAWRKGKTTADRLLNRLHSKVQEDAELLGAIRSIAFFSGSPRCEILNRAADLLEQADGDLAAFAANLKEA